MKNSSSAPSPGIIEILLQVLLSTVVGALAAFIFLVIKPVETVNAMPAKEDRVEGIRYLVLGEASNAPTVRNRWERLLENLENGAETGGATITIAEDDLNHWASAKFAEPDEDRKRSALGEIAPTGLNFRIAEEQLQIFVNLDYQALGFGHIFPLEVQGSFVERGDEHRFKIDRVFLGQSRIPPIPGVRSFLLNRIRMSYPVPPALERVLKQADELNIEDRVIVVRP